MKHLPIVAVVVAAIVIFGIFLSIVTQGFQELAEIEQEHRSALEQKARLEANIKNLNGMLEALRSDPAAVESLARRDLGWVRSGEKVILLATPTPAPGPSLMNEAALLSLPGESQQP